MGARERGDASPVEHTELLRATRRGRPDLLGPGGMRSLDAPHLASALTLAADLEGIVTYDVRLRDAALAVGLTVVAPA